MKDQPDDQQLNRPEVYQTMKQLGSQSGTINILQQGFKTKMSLYLIKFTLCELMKAWGFGATHTCRIWELADVRIEIHNMAVF
jgi:hypothetical protein